MQITTLKMKKFLSLLLIISSFQITLAKEGMWIPMLLNNNIAEMQAMGCELTAEDIYSVNNSSLKDAIVSFGGFCTGEFISAKGPGFNQSPLWLRANSKTEHFRK